MLVQRLQNSPLFPFSMSRPTVLITQAKELTEPTLFTGSCPRFRDVIGDFGDQEREAINTTTGTPEPSQSV
jgi:hypothetical protein